MAKFLHKRLPSVFVAIPTAGKDGQLRLEGVLRYLRLGHAAWKLKLVISQATIPVDEIRTLAQGSMDAFLLHLPYDRREIGKLSALGKPIVITTALDRPTSGTRALRFVLINNRDIGREAANHLMSLGRFASYGFVPCAYETNWSRERGQAFVVRLRENGLRCSVFGGLGDIRTRTHDHDSLVAWLKALPLPAAVFAANDNYALQTLLACDAAGIEVPKQLAILGVDNDELIVGNFSPSITSIEPDFAANGFNAARELDRMLKTSNLTGNGRIQRLCAAKPRLVVRESTAFLTPASMLVENAIANINRFALSGATPATIAAGLGVSRCLLDLRLRQAGKPTLGTLLRNRRMEEVRHLLTSTQLPTAIIAERCAFPNANHLRNLFKATYGTSMRDWRKSKGKVSRVGTENGCRSRRATGCPGCRT